ncbi:MAG: AAA family ATPase [Steroidobacteraceae bacterium]|nr:AAA family ATPase [Steroidobacteraceae bacterium]
MRFDAFELDEANARLLRDGRAIPLAPKPFALLCTLVRQAGGLLTKHQLLDEVWGHQFVSDSVLKTAISDLRTALADDPRQPRFIETVSRRGYRFIARSSDVAAVVPVAAGVIAVGAAHGAPFVGREPELARLHRAWHMASAGKPTVVFVAGEPGIGKTALIERFISSRGDALCARGQCVDQYGAGEPYLPVLEALAELCRADDTLPGLLRAVAPAWLLQLPWLCSAEERDRLRTELAGVGPDRMLREMGELLVRCTERRPLLVVTEDLHWSDRATVQLIDYIARRRTPARLMWLVSFRLAEVVATDHPLSPIRHELRLHGLCEEIVLDPFSETEVAACVATQSRSLAGSEAFIRALHERTDGVPLFVASVLREAMGHASREDADPTLAARLVGAAVPENLSGIVDRYIARLDAVQHELLAAAAVLGVEPRVTTLARVLDRDEASVERVCESLAREQFWFAAPDASRPGSLAQARYAFRHALFRQILYERTAPLARAQLHRKAGAALEQDCAAGLPVTPAELAMHFERGGDSMQALRHYAEAATSALRHLAPAECLELTERALAMVESAPAGVDRDELEIALATTRGLAAFQVMGVSDETRDAFSRAYRLLEAVPHHRLHALTLHGLGWVLSLRAEYADALAVAGRAEAQASLSGDPALLQGAAIVQASVHMLQGRPREACRWIEPALASIDTFETKPDQSFAADPGVTLLAMHGLQLLHLGLVAQGRARVEQARARALGLGQPMSQLVALWYQVMFELRLGEVGRVRALADEMGSLVAESSLALGRTASQWFRGWADARLGMPREGHDRIRAAHGDNLRFGMVSAESETLGYAAEALLLTGDAPAAQAVLDEALDAVDKHSERIYLPQLLLLQAGIARARGEPVAAEAAMRSAVAEARSQEAPWLELLALLELCESGIATDADRQALDVLLDRIPDAADTAAVKRARALPRQ